MKELAPLRLTDIDLQEAEQPYTELPLTARVIQWLAKPGHVTQNRGQEPL